MEVKPGYKQTEVGMIPVDWEVKPLSIVLVKGRLGGNYSNQSAETQFPLMKMGNLARGNFDTTKVEYIAPTIQPEEAHRLSFGDVLFNTRNTLELVGKVAMWRDELPVAYYNSNLMRLEFNPAEIFSNEYANAALNTNRSIAKLRALATGTTSVAAIYTRDLLEMHFIVPPLPEQRAIATALSDMDALLDGLDRLITKKRAIKQATMQQLLTGQTRLPGFSGEWEVKRLGDLGIFLKGSGVRKDEAQSGALPCIRYGELYTHHHDVIRSFNSYISHEVAQSATRIRAGDVLFAGSGETKEEIGKCAAFTGAEEAYAGGDIVILRLSEADPIFMGYCCNTPSLASQKASFGQGDAVVHISEKALAGIEVYMPGTAEQTAIAAVLSDIDTEIAALETRRTKTRALKKAVMQELLTGRIRLVTPDAKPTGEVAAQTEGRKPNVHFLRSVLAAEIIDQLHDQPTFGHVKFEKMMFLAEHLCEVDTGSTYHRKAAGPYDNRALRSIDSQLQKQQWFEARKEGERYQYVPLAKRGGHKPYFERHFSGISAPLEKILRTFKTAKTVQCEIVATLLAAWSDLLREKEAVSDEMIVHEVLHNWHEAKQRIPEDRWLAALGWMRGKGFVPKGVTLP